MEESNFIQRQNKLASLMPETAIVISAAKHMTKSHDNEFLFHQNTHLKYLTGFREPESLLVLTQKNGEGVKSHFFVRPKDDFSEMWHGKRLGIENTKEIFKFDYVYDISKAWEIIPSLLLGHKKVACDWAEQSELTSKLLKVITTLSGARKKKEHKPTHLVNVANMIGQLRLIKDANELQFMRKAASITNLGHRAAMSICQPGKTEFDVKSYMEYIFRLNGSEDDAYPSIVAGGKNALILHYVENNALLNDKELMLIDAGSQFNGYASDVTRTFPINGKFSSLQKEVYEIVLASQKVAIGLAKPGSTIPQIHKEVEKVLARALLDAGLITSTVEMSRESLEEILLHKDNHDSYALRSYYPHGTSHWIGLDVHDMSPYLDNDLNELELRPGMVITIEPGLYFNKAHDQIKFKLPLHGIGIRIEDDILITDKGHENLTGAIPKEINEIEEACKVNYKDFL